MPKYRYITRISQIPHNHGLPEVRRRHMEAVTRRYLFRSNEYYQSLIDWNDPNDPIHRIVMPHIGELQEWGRLDASRESDFVVAPGLEHKYRNTVVLLVNDVCGGLCRFCFRKRLFLKGNAEVARDVAPALDYIRRHPQINNVLVTGGDPLLLSTRKLERILTELRSIDHVRILRIGTKMPVFNPHRILDDPALPALLRRCSSPGRPIYLMAHVNHPRELTDEAVRAFHLLQKNGVFLMNQTPLIRGVNDDPAVLGELFNALSYLGISPYYVFQCRPTAGNAEYVLPLEEAYRIFAAAQRGCSGLARRNRFVMSHNRGKIEVVGLDGERIIFRYHRAARTEDEGRFLVCRRNPRGYWFDDFEEEQATPADDPEPLVSRHIRSHRT